MVPVSKSSADRTPPTGRSKCVWTSIPPGLTSAPEASTTSAPSSGKPAPTPAMRSPTIITSPGRAPAASTSVPPRIRMAGARPPGSLTRGSALLPHAGRGVELLDHAVPHRDQVSKTAPELLSPPPLEVLERDPLLLHPREVPQIEHSIPVD